MKQPLHYKITTLTIRILMSIGLTVLLCFYLPNYLNHKPALQLLTPTQPPIEMALPEIEKQKTPQTEVITPSQTPAKTAPPLTTNLPVMAAVADIPIHQPVIAAPSINKMALPSLAPLTMGIKDVDQPPELLKYVQPQMPIAGRKYKGGKVLLRLIVEANGVVSQADVLEATPQDIFDEAALKAARKWRFKPAKLSGETVRVFVDVPLNFKVD